MTPTSEIRAWLAWRARQDLPPAEVAAEAGLDVRAVTRFVAQRDRRPMADTVVALYRVLKADAAWTAKVQLERREANAEAREA